MFPYTAYLIDIINKTGLKSIETLSPTFFIFVLYI